MENFHHQYQKGNDIYIKNSEYQGTWLKNMVDKEHGEKIFNIILGQPLELFFSLFPIPNFTLVASQLQISIMKIKIIISLTKKLTEDTHNQQNYTKEKGSWQKRIFQLMNIVEHNLIPDEGS